jgi:ParB family chromosome partitioning protein
LVAPGEIRPNPQQPRTEFDEAALEDLANSIREVGVLQPLIVRQAASGYVLVAGERRWRAAQAAELAEIPVIIRSGDDTSSLTEALIENVQREDLTPLEEAAAYQQLQEDFGLTHAEIGQRVGKSRAAISNALRLLLLPPAIQSLLREGRLSAGHSRALLGMEDSAYAVHIATRAADEGWSVRQVEDAVRARVESTDEADRPAAPKLKEVRPAAIIELEQRLQEHLGTPVKISYRANKGRVTMNFTSLEELEQIYRTLFGA